MEAKLTILAIILAIMVVVMLKLIVTLFKDNDLLKKNRRVFVERGLRKGIIMGITDHEDILDYSDEDFEKYIKTETDNILDRFNNGFGLKIITNKNKKT